jgi:hypothetical protein
MSLRARIFIIISVILLLVLSISIFLIVRSKKKNTDITPAPNNVITDNTPNIVQPGGLVQSGTEIPAGLPAKVPTSEEVEKNGVEQLAKVFVERYGTYSTDNEGQNIRESQTLVTKSLWSKISAGLNNKTSSQSFLGITTKAMSVTLSDWSGTKAVVSLKTMRAENKNGTVTTLYQNATVDMVKENGVWLADKLVWN